MKEKDSFEAVNAQIFMIKLTSIADIKEFVSTVAGFFCDATLISGRYRIDAKSIMGVFSLDTTKPIKMVLETGPNGVNDKDDLREAINRFVIDE